MSSKSTNVYSMRLDIGIMNIFDRIIRELKLSRTTAIEGIIIDFISRYDKEHKDFLGEDLSEYIRVMEEGYRLGIRRAIRANHTSKVLQMARVYKKVMLFIENKVPKEGVIELLENYLEESKVYKQGEYITKKIEKMIELGQKDTKQIKNFMDSDRGVKEIRYLEQLEDKKNDDKK